MNVYVLFAIFWFTFYLHFFLLYFQIDIVYECIVLRCIVKISLLLPLLYSFNRLDLLTVTLVVFVPRFIVLLHYRPLSHFSVFCVSIVVSVLSSWGRISSAVLEQHLYWNGNN